MNPSHSAARKPMLLASSDDWAVSILTNLKYSTSLSQVRTQSLMAVGCPHAGRPSEIAQSAASRSTNIYSSSSPTPCGDIVGQFFPVQDFKLKTPSLDALLASSAFSSELRKRYAFRIDQQRASWLQSLPNFSHPSTVSRRNEASFSVGDIVVVQFNTQSRSLAVLSAKIPKQPTKWELIFFDSQGILALADRLILELPNVLVSVVQQNQLEKPAPPGWIPLKDHDSCVFYGTEGAWTGCIKSPQHCHFNQSNSKVLFCTRSQAEDAFSTGTVHKLSPELAPKSANLEQLSPKQRDHSEQDCNEEEDASSTTTVEELSPRDVELKARKRKHREHDHAKPKAVAAHSGTAIVHSSTSSNLERQNVQHVAATDPAGHAKPTVQHQGAAKSQPWPVEGDKVEVRSKSEGLSWWDATVLKAMNGKNGRMILVSFDDFEGQENSHEWLLCNPKGFWNCRSRSVLLQHKDEAVEGLEVVARTSFGQWYDATIARKSKRGRTTGGRIVYGLRIRYDPPIRLEDDGEELVIKEQVLSLPGGYKHLKIRTEALEH